MKDSTARLLNMQREAYQAGRSDGLEEAAKLFESMGESAERGEGPYYLDSKVFAKAIRALAGKKEE